MDEKKNTDTPSTLETLDVLTLFSYIDMPGFMKTMLKNGHRRTSRGGAGGGGKSLLIRATTLGRKQVLEGGVHFGRYSLNIMLSRTFVQRTPAVEDLPL